jgi:VWFA-related protein
VTVRVVDRRGQPITDLSADDFTVLENGVPQRVSLFASQDYADGAVVDGLRVRTGQDDPAKQQRRIFVILLGRGDSDGPVDAVDGVIHLVRDLLRPQDLVAVIAWNRATPFTVQHERIAALLERFKSARESTEGTLAGLNRIHRPPSDEMPPMEIPVASLAPVQAKVDAVFQDFGPTPRATRSVQQASAWMRGRGGADASVGPESMSIDEFMALRRVAQPRDFGSDLANLTIAISYLRHFEGEKHVILLSENGLVLPTAEDDRRLARLAASANVIVDYVHTGGAKLLDWTLQTARTLTEATGGRDYLFQFPKTAAAMDDLDRTTRREYVLGYYAPTQDDRAGPRQIQIRVRRDGATALYRRDYVPEGMVQPLDREQTYRDGRIAAAASRLQPFTDIGIHATATALKPPAPARVRVDMKIDASSLAFARDSRGRHVDDFTLVGYCVDAREHLVGRFWKTMQLTLTDERLAALTRTGIVATLDIPVTGTAARVKIVAYDYASDSLGSAIVAVK